MDDGNPRARRVAGAVDHGSGPAALGTQPSRQRHAAPPPAICGARGPAPHAGERLRPRALRDDRERRPRRHGPADAGVDGVRQDRRQRRGNGARQRHVQRAARALRQVHLDLPAPGGDRPDPARIRRRYRRRGRNRPPVARHAGSDRLLQRVRGGGRRRTSRASRVGPARVRRFGLGGTGGLGGAGSPAARRFLRGAALPCLRDARPRSCAGAPPRSGGLRLRPERVDDAAPESPRPCGRHREDDPRRAAERRRLRGPRVERRRRGVLELHARGPRRRRVLVSAVLLPRQPLRPGGALRAARRRASAGRVARERRGPLRFASRRGVRVLERAVQPDSYARALGPAQQPGPRHHRLPPSRAAGLARAVPPQRAVPPLRDRSRPPVRQDLRGHGRRATAGRSRARHRARVRRLRRRLPGLARMGQRDRPRGVAALRLDRRRHAAPPQLRCDEALRRLSREPGAG